jgi:heat shock protein HslJ
MTNEVLAARALVLVRALATCAQRFLIAALSVACHACAGAALAPPPETTAEISSIATAPPTFEELRNLTFTGLDERLGPIRLEDGRWMGPPATPGSVSRPIVALADEFRIAGDLDGDGADETVVLVTYRPGGTGSLSFLAVVARKDGALRNLATTPLGDRVQLRSARIDRGRLLVSAVRAGEKDAACCPGDLVEWEWVLGEGRLNALRSVTTGRLSPATLAGTVWVLRGWDLTEAAGSQPVVTLVYDAGRFTGTGGCNRYFAAVNARAAPGELSVGPVAGTRMACPEPQSSIETRFLEQLGKARGFGFFLGRLMISYEKDVGGRGTMLFESSAPPKAP